MISHTGGGVVGVFVVGSGAEYMLVGLKLSEFERGDRNSRLYRRAGGIYTLKSSVVKRIIRVGEKLIKILRIGCKIIRREQIYEKDKFVEMDSMHDSIATNISIKDKTLLITYDNLNEGVIGRDGLPYYKNKKLTIEYVIDSYCDVKFFRRNKYKYVDLLEENNKFYKLINGCSFMSYKYAIDSFGEIILFFNIREKNKYWCFEISMDAEKIIYHWE